MNSMIVQQNLQPPFMGNNGNTNDSKKPPSSVVNDYHLQLQMLENMQRQLMSQQLQQLQSADFPTDQDIKNFQNHPTISPTGPQPLE